ncbi:MAG: sulfurtransferase complex subunit TusC [Gammaproteobacteria bacterium]|nr:sulfurtransferase complex subunit TusC [Gammaproteobacteria bacterium]
MLCRRAPYAGYLARAGLDAALAAAVFEQDLTVLFMDEGIWQLLPDQHSAEIECKSIASTLDSMPLYDIESFYVDAESLRLRDVDAKTLTSKTILLGAAELPGFLDSFEQLWSF